MTPPAITDAGRAATVYGRRLKPPPAPRAPRRVSGPLRPKREAAPPRATRETTPLSARALGFARALPDHRLLDKLVRARSWIPVLALMLAGIVAMQVSLLKLGATTGRLIERSGTLQSQNEQLRAKVGALADDQRIERLAAGMGMVMPAPTAVTFLAGDSSITPAEAVGAITPPNPVAFEQRQQTAAVTDPTQTTTTGGPATVPVTSSTSSSIAASAPPASVAPVQTASAAASTAPAASTAAPVQTGTTSGSAGGAGVGTGASSPPSAAGTTGGAAAVAATGQVTGG